MKASYSEGLAIHAGPESCGGARERTAEALTGVRTGRVFSREINLLRGADAVRRSGRPYPARRYRKMRRDPARSETPCTYGNHYYGVPMNSPALHLFRFQVGRL
jgi:hypothetical protein